MQTLTSIDLADARELGEHIFQKALADGGEPVAIVIVDAHANPVWAISMNGTKPPSWTNAHAKACTAVEFEHNTIDFRFYQGESGMWIPLREKGWSELDLTQAMSLDPRFCGWAGGSPIINEHDRTVMGGIGVSNREEVEDHDLASSRPSGWTA